MLLTAEDTLLHAHGNGGRAMAAARLLSDLFITVITENSKQIGANMKKSKQLVVTVSIYSLVLLALKIVAVAFLSFVWLASVLHAGENMLSTISLDMEADIIRPLIPLMMLPLAFLALRKVPRLTVWDRVTWSYALGLGGVLGFGIIGSIVGFVATHFYPLLFSYELYLQLAYLAAFYFTARVALRPRLQSAKS
jgi:hypothetical protein